MHGNRQIGGSRQFDLTVQIPATRTACNLKLQLFQLPTTSGVPRLYRVLSKTSDESKLRVSKD